MHPLVVLEVGVLESRELLVLFELDSKALKEQLERPAVEMLKLSPRDWDISEVDGRVDRGCLDSISVLDSDFLVLTDQLDRVCSEG